MKIEELAAEVGLLGVVDDYQRCREALVTGEQYAAMASTLATTPMECDRIAADLTGNVASVKAALSVCVKPAGVVKGILEEIIGGFPGNIRDDQVQQAQARLCFHVSDALAADIAKAAISPALVGIIAAKLALTPADVRTIASAIDAVVVHAIETM